MSTSDPSEKNGVMRIGLLLVDGFALMSYAALIEPFRAANVLAGRELYAWTHLVSRGEAGQASNGARIMARSLEGAPADLDMVFVFAGGDPRPLDDPALFAWLRRLHRQGATVAGISAGPFLLARAGLLAGRRATIHWEHGPAMQEAFPDVVLENGLYAVDERVMTCAGGTSGLDLALDLIARDHGRDLAVRVGDWLIRSAPRDASAPQRLDHAERSGLRNRAVREALAMIEESLDQPPTRAALAARAGLSVRHLERLFQAHLGDTIHGVTLAMRLELAHHLLKTTDLKVTDVAFECGFASAAHFSRLFARRFGLPPTALRGQPAMPRIAAARP